MWTPTPQDIAKIEVYASRNLSFGQIALLLGTTDETLRKRRRTIKQVEEAIQRGRAKGLANITNKLYEKAENGDMRAIEIYLRSSDPERWSEKKVIEQSGPGGGPIPHALAPETVASILGNMPGMAGYLEDDMAGELAEEVKEPRGEDERPVDGEE